MLLGRTNTFVSKSIKREKPLESSMAAAVDVKEEKRTLTKSLNTIDTLIKALLPEIEKGRDNVPVKYEKKEDLKVTKHLLEQELMKKYFEGVLTFEYKKLGKEYKGCELKYQLEDKSVLTYTHKQ